MRLWCSLNVCKDNAYGKFLDLEPTRKEKFAKVYTESGIRADCNASDFWFWLDEEVNINFEDFKTIKDILDSNQPVAVKATAAVITNLLNSYTQIDAI